MRRLALLACCIGGLAVLMLPAAEPAEGVLPVGADGKALNLDFETGTLKDWTAEGDAFKNQPVKGDAVNARRGDMKSNHQGQYWIGTYERGQDAPQGVLTSVAFAVTHPWASFLVGGGAHPTTCVEIIRKDTGAVVHRASGTDTENMRRDVVDLKALQGKEVFIRVVDKHSGGWGHINFDDFRFHTERPKIAPSKLVAAPDTYKYAGLTPEKAASVMTVPEDFTVQLFAGEPDVCQPIAFCFDDRGRLWVAEAYSYPIRRPDKEAKDRIVIFEDSKGAGKFDKRTVFMEGLNLVSGIEYGFGGIWIGAAPHFMFVPIADGEDKPAGPPQILLDGWGWQDTHETLNTFCWGPDGWLYGCHGVFTHSRVGKPGTPDKDRTPINAGVWRYHPTRHVFEVFAHGTSNPWGLDYNDQGQFFSEACVIPHAFHIVQGGRYQRQAGDHFNPHTYDDIKTIADHFHYVGGSPHGGNNRSDGAGGGHAHCGTMIYLGGAWPAQYRNQMFMGNLHGHRINVDLLREKGSGYVAGHGPDFLLANDAWSRFINLRYGPDGNVFLIDWYDKQACHSGNVGVWDRTNGRIYKVSYRGTKPVQVDLQKCTDQELVDYQLHANDWYVRHARRILQERKRTPEELERVKNALKLNAAGHQDELRQVRSLWALHTVGGLQDPASSDREKVFHFGGLSQKSPLIRAWMIQLILESREPYSTLLRHLEKMAADDPSPLVRRYLASAAQRLPLEKRWDMLQGLVSHAEDADDPNLPYLYWYALEPLADKDPTRALKLALDAKIPRLAPFMVRRIASAGTPEALQPLVAELARSDDLAVQKTFLRGLSDALKARRQAPMPAAWPAALAKLNVSKDAEVRAQVAALSVKFGDAKAFAALRQTLADGKADAAARQSALAALLAAGDKELPPLLQQLLGDVNLRGPALRGLAAFDDPRTPAVIVEAFAGLSPAEKRDALGTLAARAPYARALLDAVAAKKIAAGDVPVDLVRQMRNLQDKALDDQLAAVWGQVRTSPADRLKQIADLKRRLNASTTTAPDLALGRAVFAKTCQQCHMLFGLGGKVGPDITGANRSNLDYLLENIVDPSAVIPKEYAASVVALKSGRVLTGIVRNDTANSFVLLLPNETVNVSKDDVEFRKESDVSMMPDGQLAPLREDEIRGLIAYLQSPVQAPLLATADNVKDFFNGRDLAGWDGDPKLWSVEDGVVVGRSPGLKHNEFLRSQMSAGDFRLTLKVKLTPDKENSGIQFRSEPLPRGEMRGPQADIGKGWWGKLYDENGRGLLWDKSGEAFVKADDWNDYEIVAEGSRIRTFINGKPCVDLDDAKLPARGVFAFQLHSGGALEVRFKDLKLEVLGAPSKP